MKKKIFASLLCLILLVSCVACGNTTQKSGVTDAKTAAKAWMADAVKNNTLMSFVYDGVAYAEHIGSWDKSVEDTADGQKVTYKKDGLTVWTEISWNEELAAYEWCSYFKNEGSADTKIVSDVLALDSVLEIADPTLTTAEGTSNSELDFQPYSVDLTKEPEFSVKTSNGTPTAEAFPYFDISNGEHGVIGAIGWTGNWKMNVTNNEGKVRLQAGMTETKFYVCPQEQLRTPMMVLQFFTGDQDAGHNAWRRLMYAEYTPIDNETGKPMTHLPTTINAWGGLSEQSMLNLIRQAQVSGFDYDLLWIDAGWYGNRTNTGNDGIWMQEVGNWHINRDMLPNGFDKIDAALEEQGKDLLLWMMHETVNPESDFVAEHPEYLLPSSTNHRYDIVDYSEEEVLQFMLDYIGDILEDAGAEWLRVDFTGSLGEKWKLKDATLGDNRVGITEIHYVTNLYRLYDGLKERIPGLMIDNCASGGTRLDIETVRRTVCLWRSDLHAGTQKGNADGTRHQAANTFWWLPLTTSGWSNDGNSSTYTFRSLFASGFGNFTVSDEAWYKQMMEEFAVTREMMTGDYYILASGQDESYDTVNAVYEFFLPEQNKGMLMAFRPENSIEESGLYKLKGLDANTTYELTLVDNGQTLTMTGEKLMNTGLALNFPAPNLSLVIYINPAA